jgi:quinol monooxygenase YgiN
MTSAIIFEAKIKEGKLKEFVDIVKRYIPDMNDFAGFQGAYINSKTKTGSVYIYQRWESVDCYQKYAEWRKQSGVLDVMMSYFKEQPKITTFPREVYSYVPEVIKG